MERKQGTLRLAYLLGIVFTLGVSILLLGSLGWFDSPSFLQSCSGLSGWVVALAFWSAKEDEAEGIVNDRMLFGVLRVPGRFMPILVLIFYLFLVPGTSLLTHLFSAALAYCYATKRLPERILLSDDAIRQCEQKAWLKPVVSASRFVPLEAASRDYLPIASNAGLVSGFSTASSAAAAVPSSATPQAPFPGEGRRLGDV
ncbi:hypothetical protein BCR43DRAFT_433178 [Syncephalastrum racemosum]|uniref:Uncharacterized protein n=1 Tax=Syncephalastrum racemosum TaxID=13706 RepID=A0A1X2HNV6_SYNRA|nr:hypothetical protein BCR43DRAFT_433178 [Syncephalastrum racemosum]